ncbi:MAG: 2Fe-2S iron-sulfur cluster binding domain-containing protein [Alphaproteobacteria bacterium]|jgi:ferredoxin-NADP reductase/predicted pyridoxine 5'-phosphate oxidase superfamily flavin-nucleotide-binding protein/ferredoxin|nr:2Fe-2S iron-sulfur cluster binding domain-containing protein [Alphaproteobacteria bacterium]
MGESGWSRADSPFHAGERAIQERLGVRERIEAQGRRMIRDHLPDQHRAFYTRLPVLFAGSVDAAGRPWASVIAGRPGFVSAPDLHHLTVAARPTPGDPLAGALRAGAPLGLLGMEFATRRRNRLNGHVTVAGDDGFTLAVDQSFGNCPQYIQTREPAWVREPDDPPPQQSEHLDGLDEAAGALIAGADTLFIATAVAADGDPQVRGVDMSHRGGRPGFVGVAEDGTLTIPDFPGNNHFNTIGNLALDPRAGLLFVDFENGDVLQLTGRVEIVWDGPAVRAWPGAERLLRFRMAEGRHLPGGLPLRWTFGEFSPHSLAMGTGEEADAAMQAEAEADRDTYRPYRVVRKVAESETITSFHLEPADGGAVPSFQAGQYLPIRLAVPGRDQPVRRTYTVTAAPGDPRLRLSVKREGPAGPGLPPGLSSNFLHDHVGEGDTIQAMAPRGDFVIDAAESRPALLLSAGVGITPMLAMLRHVVQDGERTGRTRPVRFVHGSRNGRERPFAEELAGLAAASDAVRVHIAYSRPDPADRPGRDYDSDGRITVDLLTDLLPVDDVDVYLCGPAGFMQDLYDGLRALTVPDCRIFAESFGPAALTRRPDDNAEAAEAAEAQPDDATAATSGPAPAEAPREVGFRRSGITATWQPGSGTLLELAEAAGLSPDFGCRSGICQTCSSRLIEGTVAYVQEPESRPPEGEVLICSAVPAASADTIALDI